MATASHLQTDVIVLGGGPAGAAIALTLARANWRVTVVERTTYSGVRIGETLPPAVQKPLVKLGLWDQFIAQRHAPSFGIYSAWGSDELRESNFIFDPYGSGWHVDRSRFDAMIACAAERAGAVVYRGSHVTHCVETIDGNWEIECKSGSDSHHLRARFLVDATGRSGWFTRKIGIDRMCYDKLVGIVGFLSPLSGAAMADDHTLVEAAEDGWWYSAQLPDSRWVVAFMTDADLKPVGRACLRTYWQVQLDRTRYTYARKWDCTLECDLQIAAANSFVLRHSSGENWLAVGDAASAYDPLSSRGVYNALTSGLQAGDAILRHACGDDPGAITGYEGWTHARFGAYLKQRAFHYGREKRWPKIFRQRRRSEPEAKLRLLS